MRQLAAFIAGYAVGYVIVDKVIPVIQSKIEALNLDEAWDVFNEEWT